MARTPRAGAGGPKHHTLRPLARAVNNSIGLGTNPIVLSLIFPLGGVPLFSGQKKKKEIPPPPHEKKSQKLVHKTKKGLKNFLRAFGACVKKKSLYLRRNFYFENYFENRK